LRYSLNIFSVVT